MDLRCKLIVNVSGKPGQCGSKDKAPLGLSQGQKTFQLTYTLTLLTLFGSMLILYEHFFTEPQSFTL